MGFNKSLCCVDEKTTPLEEEQRRLLDSHFFKCCGGFDRLGWTTCCLVTWCPCVAVGQNMRRITGNKQCGVGWGLQHLIIVIILLGLSCALGGMALIYYQGCYGSSECTQMKTTEYSNFLIYLSMGLFATWIFMLLTGMAQRECLRRVLEVEYEGRSCMSQFLDDWRAAWCLPCSICQETRTLVQNRVEDGIWLGPEGMQVVSLENQFP